jgi:hypothetical protein
MVGGILNVDWSCNWGRGVEVCLDVVVVVGDDGITKG